MHTTHYTISMTTQQTLLIIQSRGLGDIIIALPIAKYYYDQGVEVHWPVCEEFYPSFKDTAPYIKWHPMKTDPQGTFFYAEPMRIAQELGCDWVICLYQSLNVVPELSKVPYFQIQHFDEFKYSKAKVPFLKKWTLGDCITRSTAREDALYSKLVTEGEPYYVTHFEGSNFEATPDLSGIPDNWLRIDINKNTRTDCVFDWLRIIEEATAVICVDSCVSNMIDQLQIDVDKYWIPRSHIHLTPTLGSGWEILEAPDGSAAKQVIFAASPK